MDAKIDSIIDKIIIAEGGSKETNDSADGGGRTKYGISEKANPEAWADGDVTLSEARDIYFQKYVKVPGFDKITDQKLLHQVVDFGVNSGPSVAAKRLQEALGVPQDGKVGEQTLATLEKADARVINNKLVALRVKMLCNFCVKNPSQLKFLNGWINRALEFLV